MYKELQRIFIFTGAIQFHILKLLIHPCFVQELQVHIFENTYRGKGFNLFHGYLWLGKILLGKILCVGMLGICC